MKILVSGSTGFVGTALVKFLKRQGHNVIRLVRRRENTDEAQIGWDIRRGQLDPASLEGIDAVIHLAGESIAGGRWSEERKRRILESRVKGTRLLAETLANMENPPKTLICASAIGYYGNRGDEILTEVSGSGRGFLAEVCRQWEAAAQPAASQGIRTVNLRFGMILHPEGGALKAMLWPFRLGLAGNLGNGRQYMSWVALEDVIGAIHHALMHPELRGPVNVVSPSPVTNAEFTRALKQALIPAFLPMRYWSPPAPGIAVKGLLGEMGSELLLASQRVQPVRLLETGYAFQFSELKPALDAML